MFSGTRAGQAERDRVGGIRDPVQPRGFLGEHGRGFAPRHPVLTVIDLVHERLAGGLEFGERAVFVAEVGVFGHEVGLGEFHGRFDPALGGRVRGLAGQHRHPVVPGEVQGLLVPDRDPGNMGGGDGLLVVRQHISRRPAEDPEAPVQGREDARRRPVPSGITIRKRENASQATNRIVFTPPIRGPSPKSYCSHMPGSVIQGRWTRVWPSRHAALTWAIARRVERSEPV